MDPNIHVTSKKAIGQIWHML